MPRVAIVGGTRTPFVKAAGALARFGFLDLGVHVVESLLQRIKLDPEQLDELVFSTVLLDPRTPNAARELVLRSTLPKTLSAHFVSNNCISGLVAASMVADGIRSGRIKSGIAGGSESMSQPTLTLKKQAEKVFIKLAQSRSLGERLKVLSSFRPTMLLPQPPSPKEPSTGLTMGEHCELMVKEWGVPRADQDQIAANSHHNASKAQQAGYLDQEIVPIGGVKIDNIVRSDTSIEKLAKLRPVFDRSDRGTLTAGNSSPLTDGASAVCLMSDTRAKELGQTILGYIEDVEFAAIPPSDGLLMAPGLALPMLLERNHLSIREIDYFEVHEAFAGQVECNQKVWEVGWPKYPNLKPIGRIPTEKLNVNGGSVAIGHPFAATGGRLILSLVNQLNRSGKKTGAISVCAAGAMGCAMIIKSA